MNKPILTVCICTYNHINFIEQAINGVLMQELKFNFEILIADDYSTDGTRDVLYHFKNRFPNLITLLLQEKNIGAAENWVQLINKPATKYIAYLEGDDYWTDPLKLQKQIVFLEANKDYGLVHTNYIIYHNSNGTFEDVNLIRHQGEIFKNLLMVNEIGCLTAVYRSQIAKNAISDGIFSNNFLIGDYPFWLYISKNYKIGYFDEVTSVYRKHNRGVSNSNDLKTGFLFQYSVLEIQTFFLLQSEYFIELKRKINSLHRINLILAHKYQQKSLVQKSFIFLKENNGLNIKIILFYLLSKNSTLEKVYQKVESGLLKMVSKYLKLFFSFLFAFAKKI